MDCNLVEVVEMLPLELVNAIHSF